MFVSIALDWSLSFYIAIWIAFLLIDTMLDQPCVVRNTGAAPRLLEEQFPSVQLEHEGYLKLWVMVTQRYRLLVVQSEKV
jgi:hypothetical protein